MIILRNKEFSNKKSRRELEDEYKLIILRDKTYSFKPVAYVPVGRRLKDASAFGALGNMFKAVGADHRMSVAKEVNMNQVLDYLEDIISDSRNKGLDVRGKNLVSRYIGLDQDPKGFNIVLSVKDGVAIFIIYDSIGNKALDELSKEFEYVVKDNRKATYISEKVKGGYIVQLTIPSVNALANLIYNICYKLHQRINCITKTKM